MRLPVHRRLLTATILIVAGAMATWFLLVRPLIQGNAQRAETQKQTASDLRRKGGFPLDAAKLKSIRSDFNSQEAELQDRLRKVYDKARGQFESRLSAYPSMLGFRRSIFQLDYQEVYNKIRSELADQRVFLNEDVLGLSDQSTSNQTYRLVVHMWTVRDLALLAVKHKLDLKDYGWKPAPAKNGAEEEPSLAPAQLPARLRVEPVRTYTVSLDKPYFLEEFPVRMTMIGSLEQITGFVSDLTRDGNYLPLESASLRKIDEENPNSPRVEATLVCSGFLILTERSEFEVELKEQEKTNIPPIRGGSP